MTETSNRGVLGNILQIKIPQSERIKTCKNEQYKKLLDKISKEIRKKSKQIKKFKLNIFDLQENGKTKSRSLQIQILRIKLDETKFKLKELITERKKILSNEDKEENNSDATFVFSNYNRILFGFSLKDVRKLIKKYFSKNTSAIKNNKKLYINFYDLTIKDMRDREFKTNLFIFCYEMRRNGFSYCDSENKGLDEIKDITNDLYRNLFKKREKEVNNKVSPPKESSQPPKGSLKFQKKSEESQGEFTFSDILNDKRKLRSVSQAIATNKVILVNRESQNESIIKRALMKKDRFRR